MGSRAPTPGDLPDPGIEPASLMSPAGGFFPTGTTWEVHNPQGGGDQIWTTGRWYVGL